MKEGGVREMNCSPRPVRVGQTSAELLYQLPPTSHHHQGQQRRAEETEAKVNFQVASPPIRSFPRQCRDDNNGQVLHAYTFPAHIK